MPNKVIILYRLREIKIYCKAISPMEYRISCSENFFPKITTVKFEIFLAFIRWKQAQKAYAKPTCSICGLYEKLFVILFALTELRNNWPQLFWGWPDKSLSIRCVQPNLSEFSVRWWVIQWITLSTFEQPANCQTTCQQDVSNTHLPLCRHLSVSVPQKVGEKHP